MLFFIIIRSEQRNNIEKSKLNAGGAEISRLEIRNGKVKRGTKNYIAVNRNIIYNKNQQKSSPPGSNK